MPQKLEGVLKRTAVKRGYSKQRTNRYVYGTLRKTGWKPSGQKRATTAHRTRGRRR